VENRTVTTSPRAPRPSTALVVWGLLTRRDRGALVGVLALVLVGMVLETLGTISYRFWAHAEKSRVNKSVDFFLMLYRAGSRSRYRPDEVEDVHLVPLAEAEAQLTHDGEKAIIRAARRRVRDLSAGGFLAVPDSRARDCLIAAVV